MNDELGELVAAIERWRASGIDDYWVAVSYMGPAVNRFGDHELTCAGGKLWHRWNEGWRPVERGSDFWLFSVPGAFAWARDMLTKVLAAHGAGEDAVELRFDDEYGFVRFMRVRVAQRDAHNFTFEVRRFGVGAHPEYEG